MSAPLPKWAAIIKEQHDKVIHTQEYPTRCGQCWPLEALTIAWEALAEIDPPLNSSQHGCWEIARNAIIRIEKLGGTGE